jgi:hypothetical protein
MSMGSEVRGFGTFLDISPFSPYRVFRRIIIVRKGALEHFSIYHLFPRIGYLGG